jgi:hypothetical protein
MCINCYDDVKMTITLSNMHESYGLKDSMISSGLCFCGLSVLYHIKDLYLFGIKHRETSKKTSLPKFTSR